jgi:inosine/xanthosine triphosphatase
MKKIILASNNPVKVKAALNGFNRMFQGETFEVETRLAESGVSAQPMTDKETLSGAINRVAGVFHQFPGADYWIGIEGGVEDMDGDLAAFAWVVIKSGNRESRGRTGAFILPPMVARLVKEGKELGEADDIVFGRINSKRENGAIGILTNDVIDRAGLYEQAVILALVPFVHSRLYDEM